jgi:hypothetical protein
MDTETRENGKTVSSTHRELSADGKNLTNTLTLIRSDGSRETKKLVYDRITKSTGFAGAWRNEIVFPKESQTMVIAFNGQLFRIAFPIAKQYTDIKLDGTDALVYGSAPHVRTTMSAKPMGARQLITTRKVDGTILEEGTLTRSADGRTLVEEWWRPENPTVKGHKVYDRQ